MKIAVLGTGMVGKAIATKLVDLGHEVTMGSRTENNENAREWNDNIGQRAHIGTFAQAAAFAELVFNCTQGAHTLAVLDAAGADNLNGKVVVDVSNPLDFSKGMPPTLTVCNDDSIGEQVQRAFPDVSVVKTLNTVNCEIMVDPGKLEGPHDVFVSGNSEAAKKTVKDLLQSFGWKHIHDLGDITTARGTEMMMPVWLRLWGAIGHADFNYHINIKPS